MEGNLPLKIFRKFGYTSRGCPSVLEVLKNTIPFATGSCRKFKVDILVEEKAPKVSLKKKIILWSLFFFLMVMN